MTRPIDDETILSNAEVRALAQAMEAALGPEFMANAANVGMSLEEFLRMRPLGKRIARARRERGLTLEEAAGFLHAHPSTLESIESATWEDKDAKLVQEYVDLLELRDFMARWRAANVALALQMQLQTSTEASSGRPAEPVTKRKRKGAKTAPSRQRDTVGRKSEPTDRVGASQAAKTPSASTEPVTAELYQIKVTLGGVRPAVWRRLRLRDDTTLSQLHQLVQIAMGWENSHLHRFLLPSAQADGGRRKTSGRPIDPTDEPRALLRSILRAPKDSLIYQYDFGDGWEHTIVLERSLVLQKRNVAPEITGGRRACPPEDVGGAAGYKEFLQAMADARHPRHRELRRWYGGSFDPEALDLAKLNEGLRRAVASRRTAR